MGKNWSVIRIGPALDGWGNWSRDLIPTLGQLSASEEKHFKAESEAANLWQPKWNENQAVLPTAIHAPDRDVSPLEGRASGSWSVGIVEKSQGEGCSWVQKDGPRGHEGWDCGRKCLWRKARQPWKQGDTAESCIGGGAITMTLLPHMSTSGSWTIERLGHQAHDVRNNRVGLHAGCPFTCLMCWTTEKDPRQGSPLSAWTSRTIKKV